MKNCRILIISQSLLFLDAIDRLLQAEGIQVIAKASNLDDACLSLNGNKVDALVADFDDPQIDNTPILVGLTEEYDSIRRIILLSLSDNRMVVHYRERVENVTAAGLIEAICLKDK